MYLLVGGGGVYLLVGGGVYLLVDGSCGGGVYLLVVLVFLVVDVDVVRGFVVVVIGFGIPPGMLIDRVAVSRLVGG